MPPQVLPGALTGLRDQEPVAEGTHRVIFEVEDFPGLLVKVMRQDRRKPLRGLKRVKYMLPEHRRFGRYSFLFREYSSYLRAKILAQHSALSEPLAELRGLIATDLGLGMLTEKIMGEDGKLGRTVDELCRAGDIVRHLDRLSQFASWFFSCHVVANDINEGNIVLGVRNDREEFVLVDGLGDSQLIPLRSWSTALHHRSLHRRFRAMAARCGLCWDARRRRFTVEGSFNRRVV